MSAQTFGLPYLKSYSGVLNLIEEVLSSATLISGAICGFVPKTWLVIIFSVYAILTTGVFLLAHIKSFYKKNEDGWYWTEMGNSIVLVIALALASFVVISELTKGFVITGVIGLIAVMVYVLDAVDKYKIINTPRAKYVWNTPDMPV